MPSSDQGIFPERYTIIPRTLIFLTCKDSVLLIKGAPTKRLWANQYNGIGGHIEKGEDPLTAAQRELKEETGLNVDDLWLCGTIMIDTSTKPGIGIFIFRGECPHGDLQASEEGTLSWIPKTKLDSYLLVEDLYTVLPSLLNLEKGDPPLSGLYKYDQDNQLVISLNQCGNQKE